MDGRPTIEDVMAAAERIAPYVTRTPLHHYISLDRLLGGEVYVKHENHQRVGAFKVRGGVNVVAQMSEEDRSRGLVAASTGNHGQSIAYAAAAFGAKAVIVVPHGSNPGKVASMRNLGAEVVFHGEVFDDALDHVERLSREEGYKYVHSANEPALIAGVGTYTLEILEDLPDVDVIVVPVGGGSGASGTCIVAKSKNADIQVVGVQAASAPGAYRSWKEGRLVEVPMETVAEGLATRTGYELTQAILRDLLDDFVLVTDEEMDRAIVLHLRETHNLAEHAGAAALAAALQTKDRFQGKKVVLVMSGGNLSPDQLKAALERGSSN